MRNRFYTDTGQAKAFKALLLQLEDRLKLTRSVNVYLAGGMAVHLYTQNRMTMDVDAEFDGRIAIPNDVLVDVEQGDGSTRPMYIDTNYNSTFALMHPDYKKDAEFIDFELPNFRVYVLQPVDLAVSKIARFQDMDREDIRALILHDLTTADAIEQRAEQAIGYFVGGQEMLRYNIRDAVALSRVAELKRERIQIFHKLRDRAGAAYTLWEKACSQLNASHPLTSFTDSDWETIEHDVIEVSIGEHGQSPNEVADALCELSPGTVTVKRQAELRKEVADSTRALQARYADQGAEPVADPKLG
jgi:hypothetical protein